VETNFERGIQPNMESNVDNNVHNNVETYVDISMDTNVNPNVHNNDDFIQQTFEDNSDDDMIMNNSVCEMMKEQVDPLKKFQRIYKGESSKSQQ